MTPTSPRRNEFGQPIGADLPGWTPPPRPAHQAIDGRFCRLEPLSETRHAADLFTAHELDADGRNWTYLPIGPLLGFDAYRAWVADAAGSRDPLFFAIVDATTEKPVGTASLLRIDPAAGSIEVGYIHYSPLLQRAPAATEAMFLLMAHVFTLGYRRYEWKCDALNAPSRAAAQRLGFSFEGIFRQATVTKGRNRDTAWYSILDGEWPALRDAFTRWLAPENFDDVGRQRTALSTLTKPLLARAG